MRQQHTLLAKATPNLTILPQASSVLRLQVYTIRLTMFGFWSGSSELPSGGSRNSPQPHVHICGLSYDVKGMKSCDFPPGLLVPSPLVRAGILSLCRARARDVSHLMGSIAVAHGCGWMGFDFSQQLLGMPSPACPDQNCPVKVEESSRPKKN